VDGQALSKALRTDGGLYLFCRRGIVLTSFVGGASMMVIGLYGVIAACASLVAVPLARPETRAAWRRLRRR
jgi:hypothetical protein